MKRYNVDSWLGMYKIFESEDENGKWVKWEDVQKELEELEKLKSIIDTVENTNFYLSQKLKSIGAL